MRTAVNYIEHILIVTKTTSTKNRADERMISSLKSASKSCIEVTLCRPQCTALNTRRCRKHAWTTHRYTQTHKTAPTCVLQTVDWNNETENVQ